MTKFECPHCNGKVNLEDESVNQVELGNMLMVECPGCGERFVIPDYLEVIAKGLRPAEYIHVDTPQGKRQRMKIPGRVRV